MVSVGKSIPYMDGMGGLNLPPRKPTNMSFVGKKVGLEDDPPFLLKWYPFLGDIRSFIFFGWTTHLKNIPQNPCMIYLPLFAYM